MKLVVGKSYNAKTLGSRPNDLEVWLISHVVPGSSGRVMAYSYLSGPSAPRCWRMFDREGLCEDGRQLIPHTITKTFYTVYREGMCGSTSVGKDMAEAWCKDLNAIATYKWVVAKVEVEVEE